MFTQSARPPPLTHRLLTGTALSLALSLLIAPQALAGKPPKPCVPNEKKGITCEPDDPLPPDRSIAAQLDGAEIWENAARVCDISAGSTNLLGNYICGASEDVYLCTHEFGAPVASSKRSAEVCDALKPWDGISQTWWHPALPVDSVTYGWTGSCGPGACPIEVRLVMVDDPTDPMDMRWVSTLTSGKSDRVEIILFGEVDVDVVTVDPFEADHLSLDFHSMEADFKKPGTLRTLVTCNWGPLEPGDASFTSSQIETP